MYGGHGHQNGGRQRFGNRHGPAHQADYGHSQRADTAPGNSTAADNGIDEYADAKGDYRSGQTGQPTDYPANQGRNFHIPTPIKNFSHFGGRGYHRKGMGANGGLTRDDGVRDNAGRQVGGWQWQLREKSA